MFFWCEMSKVLQPAGLLILLSSSRGCVRRPWAVARHRHQHISSPGRIRLWAACHTRQMFLSCHLSEVPHLCRMTETIFFLFHFEMEMSTNPCRAQHDDAHLVNQFISQRSGKMFLSLTPAHTLPAAALACQLCLRFQLYVRHWTHNEIQSYNRCLVACTRARTQVTHTRTYMHTTCFGVHVHNL